MQNFIKAFNLYFEINRIFVVKGQAMAIDNQEKLCQIQRQMQDLHPEIRKFMSQNSYDLIEENPQINEEKIFNMYARG